PVPLSPEPSLAVAERRTQDLAVAVAELEREPARPPMVRKEVRAQVNLEASVGDGALLPLEQRPPRLEGGLHGAAAGILVVDQAVAVVVAAVATVLRQDLAGAAGGIAGARRIGAIDPPVAVVVAPVAADLAAHVERHGAERLHAGGIGRREQDEVIADVGER